LEAARLRRKLDLNASPSPDRAMSHSIACADRAAHVKTVVTALRWAILVSAAVIAHRWRPTVHCRKGGLCSSR